jgi:hypothetical protein
VAYGLKGQNGDGRTATAVLERSATTHRVAWRPPTRVPSARLYVWALRGPSAFELSGIRVLERFPAAGVRPHVLPVTMKLGGPLYQALRAERDRKERRYLQSRRDGARLALHAFRSKPLIGLGWGHFPDYAARRLDYGRFPTHNEYLRLAAELGVMGPLLFLLVALGVVSGGRRLGGGYAATAAKGVVVAGAVGLVFANGLIWPGPLMPLALSAGLLAAGGPRAAAQSSWWRWRWRNRDWRAAA